MLHTKFQDHRTSGSGEDFFRDFYHIWAWRPSCHVPWTIYIIFCSSFPRRPHIKFGQAVSEEKTFEIVDDGRWVSYKLTYEPLAQVS